MALAILYLLLYLAAFTIFSHKSALGIENQEKDEIIRKLNAQVTRLQFTLCQKRCQIKHITRDRSAIVLDRMRTRLALDQMTEKYDNVACQLQGAENTLAANAKDLTRIHEYSSICKRNQISYLDSLEAYIHLAEERRVEVEHHKAKAEHYKARYEQAEDDIGHNLADAMEKQFALERAMKAFGKANFPEVWQDMTLLDKIQELLKAVQDGARNRKLLQKELEEVRKSKDIHRDDKLLKFKESKIKELEAEVDGLKKMYAATIAGHDTEIKRMRAENDDLSSKVNGLQTKLEKFQAARQAEVKALKTELNDTKAKLKAAEDKMKEVEELNEALATDEEERNEEMAKLKTKKRELEKQVEVLEQKTKEQSKQIQDLIGKLRKDGVVPVRGSLSTFE